MRVTPGLVVDSPAAQLFLVVSFPRVYSGLSR
jgi:hypothetical protein